jgi:Tol biopolymer transport system component
MGSFRCALYLWNLKRERAVELGRYSTPKHLDGPLRVDLHPRFSHDGKRICIDSAMDGRRNMYVLDLEAYFTSVD